MSRRGMDELAATFETAIRLGSPLVWPRVFLAHHHLRNGRWDECRKLREQALGRQGSAAVMSEVAEWMAIAQAQLGFPGETVRASFDQAIRRDASNDRARRNARLFEDATQPMLAKTWETRSPSAIRASVLAERRFAAAA